MKETREARYITVNWHENDNENKCKDIKREDTQKLHMNLSVGRELITDVIVTDTSGKTATK